MAQATSSANFPDASKQSVAKMWGVSSSRAPVPKRAVADNDAPPSHWACPRSVPSSRRQGSQEEHANLANPARQCNAEGDSTEQAAAVCPQSCGLPTVQETSFRQSFLHPSPPQKKNNK